VRSVFIHHMRETQHSKALTRSQSQLEPQKTHKQQRGSALKSGD